jgi:CDP-glucose 4,6-dehydratase
VLLTGHTGFKGGWLALWLERLGATVVGISLPAGSPSFHAAVGVDALIDGRIGDIRAADTFAEALGDETFDLVIHMAAQAVVRTSYETPVDTYLTNVVGTAVVLDAARRMPSLGGVLVVTSDKCYDNREWVWGYRETDPMGGRDPYSSSKGCAELVASSYRASFFNDPAGPQIATARAGNVIGGGDWGSDRLLPDLMRSMQWGVPARLRNPRSIRPWQHVFEPLRGYLMLAAALIEDGAHHAGGWNFGPAVEATVEVGEVADRAVARWDGECPDYVVERRTRDPSEAVVLRLDSSKANVELGWKPLLDIGQAVDMTVDWYRQYARDPRKMRSFSLDQIDRYVDLWHGASGVKPDVFAGTEAASCA